MFDKDFYPTPIEVIEQMGIDCHNKVVLEPSAGKGNIVDFLQINNAKKIIVYEKVKELRDILSHKKVTILGDDFLKSSENELSHVDLIVMNPPFSKAAEHICHAFDIAPEGCEIISLCNDNMLKSHSSIYNRRVESLVGNYGFYESLGDCFKNSERKTNVEVGLIKIYKPVVSKDYDFSGFFIEEDEEENLFSNQPLGGVMRYNAVRALVNSYVGSVKCFDEMESVKEKLHNCSKMISTTKIELSYGYNETLTSKQDYAKLLQKKAWGKVIDILGARKYTTSGVQKNINKFVERQENIPFTMRNVYRMIEVIFGTRKAIFEDSLCEAIDNFTKYTHENRYNLEGWKSNLGYMLNRKFIVNYIVERNYSDSNKLSFSYRGNVNMIDDLCKVLCWIEGKSWDEIGDIRYSHRNFDRGVWYKWGFFKFKGFKKGTVHFEFLDEGVWWRLNQAYGKVKGFTLSDKK